MIADGIRTHLAQEKSRAWMLLNFYPTSIRDAAPDPQVILEQPELRRHKITEELQVKTGTARLHNTSRE